MHDLFLSSTDLFDIYFLLSENKLKNFVFVSKQCQRNAHKMYVINARCTFKQLQLKYNCGKPQLYELVKNKALQTLWLQTAMYQSVQ